ncbi:hypothetical protein B0H14DRAFT_2592989 [Mycena olivaceomarginata]|nr:hypothetical protein B0H14DRAFT_2592989 [Mycena olivaceomarginata]
MSYFAALNRAQMPAVRRNRRLQNVVRTAHFNPLAAVGITENDAVQKNTERRSSCFALEDNHAGTFSTLSLEPQWRCTRHVRRTSGVSGRGLAEPIIQNLKKPARIPGLIRNVGSIARVERVCDDWTKLQTPTPLIYTETLEDTRISWCGDGRYTAVEVCPHNAIQ